MDDEAAFLAALTANPADDVCRLVFADWLNEREQFDKATYLRLVCRAVEMIGTPAEAKIVDEFGCAAEHLTFEWRHAAAGRFALALPGRHTDLRGTRLAIWSLFGGAYADVGVRAADPGWLLTAAPFEELIAVKDVLGSFRRTDCEVVTDLFRVPQTTPRSTVAPTYELWVTTGEFAGPSSPRPTREQEGEWEAELTALCAKHHVPPGLTMMTRRIGLAARIHGRLPLPTVARIVPRMKADVKAIAARYKVAGIIRFGPTPVQSLQEVP